MSGGCGRSVFRSVLRSFDLLGQIHTYPRPVQTTSFKQRSMRLWNRPQCNISGVNFCRVGSSSLQFTVAHSDRSRASDELVLSVGVFVAAALPPLESAGRLFAESLPHASGVTPFIRQGICRAVGVLHHGTPLARQGRGIARAHPTETDKLVAATRRTTPTATLQTRNMAMPGVSRASPEQVSMEFMSRGFDVPGIGIACHGQIHSLYFRSQ